MIKPEKFWDFLARNYDRGEGDPAGREDIAITRQYLRPGDTVMDYACGTGTVAVEIAGQVGQMHAVDISANMLAAVWRKAEARGVENLTCLQADLFDEQFPTASYDAILAFNILHLLPDAGLALHRIQALLKPGGAFISNNPCLESARTLSNRLLAASLGVLGRIGAIPPVRLLRAAELEDLHARAGLQIVATRKFTGGAFGTTDYFIVARKAGGIEETA